MNAKFAGADQSFSKRQTTGGAHLLFAAATLADLLQWRQNAGEPPPQPLDLFFCLKAKDIMVSTSAYRNLCS